jgi:hypothetical protein
MIEILDRLGGNAPAIFRSLYLWQQILGPDCGAAARLRKATGPMILLPLGADVTPFLIAIQPNPDGIDVQQAVLPGADAVFACVADAGVQLSLSVEATQDRRQMRRLRVIDGDGQAHRRRAGERFMLRYRLPPQAVRAREMMFIAITQEPQRGLPLQPRLHAWVELEQDGARHFIVPDDSRIAALGAEENIHMISFAAGAISQHKAASGTAYILIELIGDPVDARLLGEALVVGG